MAIAALGVSPLGVAPSAAAAAYARSGIGVAAGLEPDAASGAAGPQAADGGFGAALGRAMDSAISLGRTAEAQSTKGILGNANLTDVVTAVSKAELALQTTVAIRDRVVQAYQDIMRMPI